MSDIKMVKTATKVGTINQVTGNPKKNWEIIWDESLGEDFLKNPNGRVYLITENDTISKIGGSKDKGGIIGTFNWYEKSALSGGPSVRTYGIHMLITESLMVGNKIDIYMIPSASVIAKVNGLFDTYEKEVSISYVDIEETCKNDYLKVYGRHPKWNFQESGTKWPLHISEGCNEINNKTTQKRKEKL